MRCRLASARVSARICDQASSSSSRPSTTGISWRYPTAAAAPGPSLPRRRGYLLQQPGVPHLTDAGSDADFEGGPGVESDGGELVERLVLLDRHGFLGHRPGAGREPRQMPDLEGADDPAGIEQIDELPGPRIDLEQCVDGISDRFHLRPDLAVVRWKVERVDDRPEMQARASGDDHERVSIAHDHRPRFPLEFGGRVGMLRFDHIDHVVADPLAFRPGRLGGPDVHPPIHLHAVDRQDRGIQFLGDTEGDLALSRSGRAEDGDESGQTACPIR